jgi:hypothetical protein
MTTKPASRRLPARHLLAFACTIALAGGVQAATWTKLARQAPGTWGTSTMFLLTDGTVMVKTGDADWSRLSPDAMGSYANGSWSKIASMSEGRQWFSSHVLPNGNVWVLGGEYSGPNMDANWTNTGEIYDSVADSWSPITNHPESRYGDVPSMLLNHRRIMTGSLSTNHTWFYDLATNAWTAGANKAYVDRSDEEAWVKLPSGSVMTYDVFQSVNQNNGYAEVWDRKTSTWSGRSPIDGTATGTLPLLSTPSVGFEMGPTIKLRSPGHKGSVLFVGADGHTAVYTEGQRNWVQTPDLIDNLNGKQVLFGSDDAPGSEMPSGHIIVAADTGPTNGTFSPPTHLFDFDPEAQTFSPAQPSFPDASYWNVPSYEATMLMLPTGELLIGNSSSQLYVYAPDGKANKKSKPIFQGLHYDGSGQFTLTGEQLNGVSAGASYGDDAEMDENYPIVNFRDASGHVFYARTTNWSNTGVGLHGVETVQLTLKAGMPKGDYELTAIGAGIGSKPACLHITADEAGGTGNPADVQPGNCNF